MTEALPKWEAAQFAGYEWMVFGEDGDIVAQVYPQAEGSTKFIATLMEAAPDMLNLLEEVVAQTVNLAICPFCNVVKATQPHRTDCLFSEIETIIRKVRGGK